ncbi:4-O-methyl-glucuronoyl methylesterase 1-like [Ostrinia furnacalis]|uniref:4-O-methyl-glucuronoyl methylesterase 1-like n=1 Tax=Ostrinia furnacalis TaxID=93504 RepID=UPI00103D8A8F|nr:4-O-methyl-glucuronoyl methylesterase 1-like [Ostrinia furnacalis]
MFLREWKSHRDTDEGTQTNTSSAKGSNTSNDVCLEPDTPLVTIAPAKDESPVPSPNPASPEPASPEPASPEPASPGPASPEPATSDVDIFEETDPTDPAGGDGEEC